MKKLLLAMLTAIVSVSFMSCESCSNKEDSNDANDLIYNVTATAEGQVEFTWFNGGAKINGDAVIYQCNDTINKVLTNAENSAILLEEALTSDDAKVADSAQEVFKMLEVKGVEGEYHLKIVGYVKYGPIIFKIDEEYPTPVTEE